MALSLRSGALLRQLASSTVRQAAFRPRISAQCLLQRAAARPFTASSASYVKKYTKDHEWIDLAEGTDVGTIGITTYAANALGDVVYVELPTVDLEVSAGDTIGSVESVKSASDILTPVSGKIVEANDLLESKPGTINQGPEGEGWLAKIQLTKKQELDGLMDADGYKSFTEDESSP